MRTPRRFTPAATPLEGRALLAPVISPVPTQFTVEVQTVTVQVQATDAGPTTFSLSQAPAGATIDAQTGIEKFTAPANAESFLTTVVATAADGSASVTWRTYVFDSPPIVFGEVNSTIVLGQQFAGSGSFASPDAGTFQANVDFGDGSGTNPLALIGDTFALGHTFAAPGTYIVSVQVQDEQGYSGFGYFAVTVLPISAPTPPAPVAIPTPPSTGQPAAVTPVPVAITPTPAHSGAAAAKPKHPVVVPHRHIRHVIHKPVPIHYALKVHKSP